MDISEFDDKGCYSYKKISTVTIPILLSMLMEHIIGMTDTIFLGRVSEIALGASALGTVYFLAFFVLGTGFSFGAQILIARRNGEKNYRKTGQICYAGGFFLALFSLLVLFVIKFLSPVLMPHLIQSKAVCTATIEYLDWRSYGLFFVFVTAIFRAFFVGIAQTRILTYSSIVMVLSNIALNYGLIFGKYGLPEMGIGGAALASTISEGLAMICYIFYTAKYIDLKKYGFDCYSAIFSPGILKKVFSVSFWMMLQPFLSISVWFIFFIAVERLGERTLAVVNLGRAISALPFIILHAFATTTNSLVSNIIGEGRSSQVWRLIRKITLAALIVIVPLLVVFVCIPELCLRIYTDNMPLIADSINIVYVVAIASFIQIFAFILFNAVSGTGAIKMIVFIEFVNLAVYLLFVWLVVIRMRPSPAVTWNSEVVYQTVTALFCLFYLLSGKWKKLKL
jgi:putative MATE family efflux protein